MTWVLAAVEGRRRDAAVAPLPAAPAPRHANAADRLRAANTVSLAAGVERIRAAEAARANTIDAEVAHAH